MRRKNICKNFNIYFQQKFTKKKLDTVKLLLSYSLRVEKQEKTNKFDIKISLEKKIVRDIGGRKTDGGGKEMR